MSITQAVILGFIQGISEFLPISSSGHLIFAPKLFGWNDQGIMFDVIIHLGTLIAVVFYFRRKLWTIIKSLGVASASLSCGKLESASQNGWFANPDKRLAWFVIISIIPAGIAGYFLETNSRSAMVVGISLIFWGIVLCLADRFNFYLQKKKKTLTNINNLKVWQVVLISFAQAIALIPGTSRSGITMTAGLFSKLDKKSATEFSFLMSIPIIALAGLLNIIEVFQVGIVNINLGALIIGFIVSAISGFFAIASLMKIIQKWNFLPFAVYRVVIGVFVILFLS